MSRYIKLVKTCHAILKHTGAVAWQRVGAQLPSRRITLYPGGGGTPKLYLYGYVPPNGVVIKKLNSDLERGIHFRGLFLQQGIKNCGSRLYLLLKIVADYEEAFIWCISWTNKEISFLKNRVFQFTNFLARSIKNWPISRTGYQF